MSETDDHVQQYQYIGGDAPLLGRALEIPSMPSSADSGIERFTVVYTGPDGEEREQIFDVPLPKNERFIRPRVTFNENGEPVAVEAVPSWAPSALTVTGLDPVPPPEPEGWSIVHEEPVSGAPVWYAVGPQRESREEALVDLPTVRDGASAERAVRELLFLVAIEGIGSLSRGGKGCVFRAVEALRPDIAEQWAEGADPHDLMRVYYPEGDDPRHFLIIGKHIARPIGCLNEPTTADFQHAQREDPGCTFTPVDPAECPICKETE